jgi:superfamily II DNA helicase RecQ
MDRRCIACPRTATKSQIKTKIAIWVRDQVARSVPQHERSQDEVQRDVSIAVPQVALEEDENEDEVGSDTEEGASTASSSSDEELILLDAPGPALQVKRCAVNEGEGGTSFVSSLILERGSILPCPLKATLQSLFGFSSFRHGQEWAIRRCLENERTLLVAPTGFGKSLCYAIPAAMKDGVCIVVSPLLSLIQVRNVI